MKNRARLARYLLRPTTCRIPRMSSDAVGWVFAHSPATGKTFTVHLAIADSVNDQYDQEFWMKLRTLAVKARCDRGTAQRAVGWLLDHGLLELMEGETRAGASTSVHYRFLFPEIDVIYNSRSRVVRDRSGTTRDLGQAPRATEVRHGARPIEEPNGEPKEEPNSGVALSFAWRVPAIVESGGLLAEAAALCEVMARQIEARGYHVNGDGRSKRWVLDMEQLLRIDGRDVHQVELVLAWLEKGGDDVATFWRTNVLSPATLRSRWARMSEQYQREKSKANKTRGETFGMTRDDVEAVMANARNGGAEHPPPADPTSVRSLTSGRAIETTSREPQEISQ